MKKVVLTFDDGPHPEHTPRILDALANAGVLAVFFVIGAHVNAPGGLDLVRRAAAEGHLIGNHTFSHPILTKLSPNEIRSEILQTHELIAEFEPTVKLFRPPHGFWNSTVAAIAKELNYRVVMWNASFEDWRPENQSSAWVDIAIKQIDAQRLAICDGHDRAHTAEYLPQLLERVRQHSKRKFVRFSTRRDLTWLKMQGIPRRARYRWNEATGIVYHGK